MKRILLYTLSAAFAVVALSSCNKNDNASSRVFYSFATVDNPNRSSFFSFTSDLGNQLHVTQTRIPYFRPADGQRIIAQYNIIERNNEINEHRVRLLSAYSILTKDIVEITAENDEALGNDPIRIVNMWIGSDFLNIEFRYLGFSRVHLINLGNNTLVTHDDGKTHLEFRHNANGDAAVRWFWGMASFNLLPLQENATSPLQLVIHAPSFQVNGQEEFEIEYVFGAQGSGPNEYSLDDAGEIE